MIRYYSDYHIRLNITPVVTIGKISGTNIGLDRNNWQFERFLNATTKQSLLALWTKITFIDPRGQVYHNLHDTSMCLSSCCQFAKVARAALNALHPGLCLLVTFKNLPAAMIKYRWSCCCPLRVQE